MNYYRKKIQHIFHLGIVFLILTFQYSFSEELKGLEDLGQHSKSLELMNDTMPFSSSLEIVQKRMLPKKFLSELSFGVSPVLTGITYLYSSSLDASYKFYLNEYFNMNVKYSYFLHAINQEGKDLLFFRRQNPVELEYAQKQMATLGVDWLPFYGKTVVFNSVIHFDFYFSFSAGLIELLRLEKKYFPTVSVGGGMVFWWNKWLNSRLEFMGSYYRYEFHRKPPEVVDEYLSKVHLSLGVLF